MIKNIIITVVAVLALSGCGEDRSHPADFDAAGNPIDYKNPTAVIELNATTHTLARGKYTIDRADTGNPFIFNGSKSHDNDEANQSITAYAWNIQHTFITNCVDLNTTGDKAIFKFIHVDINESNTTCYDQATGSGDINVTLTVTDDEGKTATTNKNIQTD